MSRYSVSFLDEHGEALRSELLDCATEAEAINALHERVGAHRVQLWLEDQTILELAEDAGGGGVRRDLTPAAHPMAARPSPGSDHATDAGRCDKVERLRLNGTSDHPAAFGRTSLAPI